MFLDAIKLLDLIYGVQWTCFMFYEELLIINSLSYSQPLSLDNGEQFRNLKQTLELATINSSVLLLLYTELDRRTTI